MTGIRPKIWRPSADGAAILSAVVPEGQPIDSPALQRRVIAPLRLKSRRDGRNRLLSSPDDQLTQSLQLAGVGLRALLQPTEPAENRLDASLCKPFFYPRLE
jgi:hypothetical protein